jgi:hypothetical protein
MATDLITASGAKVRVTAAPFGDAMALKNALVRELANSGISLSSKVLADLQAFGAQADVDVGTLMAHFMRLDSSPLVNDAIAKCLERCTYNSMKITADTFEDVDARGDYYEIVFACVKENITPFLKGLASKLSNLGALIQSQSQK